MDVIAEEQQLFRSCEILFGSQVSISREFLEYLQPSGLQGAYRKRALETHPDRMTGNELLSSAGSSVFGLIVGREAAAALGVWRVIGTGISLLGGTGVIATAAPAGFATPLAASRCFSSALNPW